MKKIFKIKGMNCDSCAKMIELDLEEAGINAKCSYAKSTLEADFDNAGDIIKAKQIITKSGYTIGI